MPRDKRLNVFPSFGTDARPFAKAILGSYRGGETEAVQVFNWTGADAILPGLPLDRELRDLIGEADVFLALVDAGYGDDARKTRLELAHALALRHQRGGGLVIVPLLLEPAAIGVLARWTGDGAELLGEVTGERCFDPDTGAFLLPDEHPLLHQRLVALRREHLAACRGIGDAAPPDEPAPASRPAPPGALLSGVVLLERAVLPEDAAAPPADTPDAREAARLLREAGAEVRHVAAGWLEAGTLDLASPDAAFVQVLNERGAAQAALNPDKLRHRLRAVGLDAALPRSRLVQWHPAGGTRAAGFDELAARNEAAEASFRADAPAGLAGWLKGLVRLGDGRGGPVAAYQDVDDGHRAALLRELQRVARDVLPEDPDERELHPFSSDGIGDLVSRLAARKPILVVHNINQSNPVSAPGSARKQTMGFFREVASRADEALRRRQAGPEDVFWLAVLMEGNLIDAGGLRLPSGDPLLFRWRVLTCAQRGDDELVLEGGARFADIGRDLKAWAGREPGHAHG